MQGVWDTKGAVPANKEGDIEAAFPCLTSLASLNANP